MRLFRRKLKEQLQINKEKNMALLKRKAKKLAPKVERNSNPVKEASKKRALELKKNSK